MAAGDIARSLADVRRLKAERRGTTYVIGGVRIFNALLDAGMIDEIVLLVHPLVPGAGSRSSASLADAMNRD